MAERDSKGCCDQVSTIAARCKTVFEQLDHKIAYNHSHTIIAITLNHSTCNLQLATCNYLLVDILHLIQRLENVLNESRRLPMTASLLVDEDRIFNIIDQMRVAVPEKIKQAERIIAEQDRYKARAEEEAQRIRDLAEQEAMDMVNRDAVVRNAQVQAENIIARASHDADKMRQDADAYAARVLAQIEQDMVRSLRVVQNGLNRLERTMEPPTVDDEPLKVEVPAPELADAL